MDKNLPLSNDLGSVMDKAVASIEDIGLENFIPRPGLVLVQVMPAETKTKAGIILPESTVKSVQEEKNIGVILKMADEDTDKFPLAQGDKVLFRTYAGERLDWDGYDKGSLLLLFYDGTAESDILGKFK